MTDETADERTRRLNKEAAAKAKELAKNGVLEEANDLKSKLDRLTTFINGAVYYSVSDKHKGLLKAQLVHMQSYYDVLKARLKDWE